MSKNSLPYYKRYPRDFIEGTIGMRIEVKGVYAILLDLIYLHGGRCPDSPKYICGILGCSTRMWNIAKAELIAAGKVALEDGFLTNQRAENELKMLRNFSETQTKIAQKPRPSRVKSKGYASQNLANQNQNQNNSVSTGVETHTVRAKGPTPKEALMKVLDEVHASAVVEHRQRIKAPLTAYGAERLALKLAQWQDANEAADIMIEAGWRGFEAEWAQGRVDKRQGSLALVNGNGYKPKPRGRAAIWLDMAAEYERMETEKHNEPSITEN